MPNGDGKHLKAIRMVARAPVRCLEAIRATAKAVAPPGLTKSVRQGRAPLRAKA